jgi:acid phosphatase
MKKNRSRAVFAAILLGLVAEAAPWARGTADPAECRPRFTVPPRETGIAYLDFAAAGDTGSGNARQAAVAAAMAGYSSANPLAFVLLLGDNFYENGVKSTADPQWQSKFERMYDAAALNVPFYAILGNHDYRENAEAQVDYTRAAPGSRWRMPARYYVVTCTLADGSRVELFALDTTTFVSDAAQGAWLERALAASTARWKIVFGHHPVYSNGHHGNSAGLIESLAPILAHRADVYISGHDHDLQVLQPEGGVRYLVSGAGSRVRRTACREDTVYAAGRLGFTAFRVSRREMSILVVLEGGAVDYCLTISKP